MVYIALTKGQRATVDAEDVALLMGFTWHACHVNGDRYYAYATRPRTFQPRILAMHRLITGAGPSEVVDHINHDTLDNRRCNLRVCSHRQNLRNSRRKPGKHGYVGVLRSNRLFYGRITVDMRDVYTKGFEDPESAARARDQLALLHHGEFAFLNFPVTP